jgi:hypothetical protein
MGLPEKDVFVFHENDDIYQLFPREVTKLIILAICKDAARTACAGGDPDDD